MHRPSIINPNAIFDLSIAIPYIRLDRCNTDTIGEWAVPAPSYMHAIVRAVYALASETSHATCKTPLLSVNLPRIMRVSILCVY